MYRWKIASPEEFNDVCRIFLASELGKSALYPDIKRRISIPLSLAQLITFYKNDKICGFVTVAFLNEYAEKHMKTCGILASDWRSGDIFWVVDYVVSPECDGYKMLRMVTKDLKVKKARYFRDKFKETREVRV